METYSKRLWLNKPESRSTGSVVAFDGLVDYGDGKGPEPTIFLEVADCHCKTKLHLTNYDTKEEFIEKMELLHKTIGDFITHLKE
ncbi:hypothetical protein JZU46_00775 [bacterium]|nr:hypothetical protein [bacterium]